MAKTITLNLGYAANKTVPVSVYVNALSEANHKGHVTAVFDAAGEAVVDLSALSVNAGDTALVVGSTFNTTATYEDRAISADAVVVDSSAGGGVGPTGGTFAPLTEFYSSATFASPVSVPAEQSIKFSVIGLSGTDNRYVLSGGSGAYVYIRASDGRTRINDDAGVNYNFSAVPELANANAHNVEIANNGANLELIVDGVVAGTLPTNKGICTFNKAGSDDTTITMNMGAVFNIELGVTDAWSMLGAANEFNTANSINASNVLTYNDAPSPITSAHTIDTGA